MRIVSLIVIGIFLSCGNLFGATLPRVGDSIDVAERNYFELFPQLPQFNWALVLENESGDSTFIIAHYDLPGNTRAYYLEKRAVVKLADYLNDFESVAVGRTKMNLFGLDGIVSGLRVNRSRGARLMVTKLDGTTASGRLFCMDSTTLILSHQENPPDWQDNATFTVISSDEIAKIKKKGVRAAEGTANGALAGAVLGAGLGAVITDEGAWFGKGPQMAALGSLYGVLGGAAGFIFSRYHIPKTFLVDGSSEKFALAKSWLADKASSRFMPPDLRPAIADIR